MCIDIVEIWFGIANGQISSNFDSIICMHQDNGGVLLFHVFSTKSIDIFLISPQKRML